MTDMADRLPAERPRRRIDAGMLRNFAPPALLVALILVVEIAAPGFMRSTR